MLIYQNAEGYMAKVSLWILTNKQIEKSVSLCWWQS